MFRPKSKNLAKQAEVAMEEAQRGLAMDTNEGRMIAFKTLMATFDRCEASEYTDMNSRLFMYLGDIYSQAGDMETALTAYADAVHSPKGVGDPQIHIRLGKISFDRGEEWTAADNLARALIMGGKQIFDHEDDKYFDFLMTKLDPPPEGWDAYEPPVE